jgi:glycosyltransferase involved in cell wall biosynthesis
MTAPRPRVLILRGAQANPWDLRPWELLGDAFAVSCAVTKSNLYELGSLSVTRSPVGALSDLAPAGVLRSKAAVLPLNRYVGIRELLAEADIVHAAELSYWFTAQAARYKSRYGYRLVVTVWETIPFGGTFRHPVSRRLRGLTLEHADLFLAATERARDALLLEGVAPERVRVSPPGIDLERFRRPPEPVSAALDHVLLSPARLVWEKGHHDVIRALAAIRRGIVDAPSSARPRLVIAGSGGERDNLGAYARELGVGDVVRFVPNVAYDEMPRLYWGASCVTLASLSTRSWEEQFGMVLAEAMAAGVPIAASTSGAIPEVAGSTASYFAPGDWIGLARRLAEGPLSRPAGTRAEYPAELVERYSTDAAAARLRAAYDAVL